MLRLNSWLVVGVAVFLGCGGTSENESTPNAGGAAGSAGLGGTAGNNGGKSGNAGAAGPQDCKQGASCTGGCTDEGDCSKNESTFYCYCDKGLLNCAAVACPGPTGPTCAMDMVCPGDRASSCMTSYECGGHVIPTECMCIVGSTTPLCGDMGCGTNECGPGLSCSQQTASSCTWEHLDAAGNTVQSKCQCVAGGKQECDDDTNTQ